MASSHVLLRTSALLLLPAALTFAQSSTPTPPAPPDTKPVPQIQQQTTLPAPAAPDLPDGPDSASQIRPAAVPTGPTALLDTSMGRLSCKLFSKQAPLTTANFIGLAQGTKPWTDPVTREPGKGDFYAGTTFHRVIPGFMIQGGDRLGDGTGDAGYYFQDEFSPDLGFDIPGRLAMANSGPGTNGSQFFITEVPVPELTGRHTIFGQCDAHTVDLVRSIARVDRNSSDKPTTPVTINRVTIIPDGQPIPPDPAAASAVPATAPAAPASTKPAASPASH